MKILTNEELQTADKFLTNMKENKTGLKYSDMSEQMFEEMIEQLEFFCELSIKQAKYIRESK